MGLGLGLGLGLALTLTLSLTPTPTLTLTKAREALLAAAGPVRAQGRLDEAEAQWLRTALGAHGGLGAGAAPGQHKGPSGS